MNPIEAWEIDFRSYEEKSRLTGRGSVLDVIDEEWKSSSRDLAEMVRPYVEAESSVLEIGCGLGRISRWLIPCAYRELVLSDVSDEILQKAKALLSPTPKVRFARINGRDLDLFRNETFDIAFSFGTFFHLDLEQVYIYLAEIRRTLKPGGICILEFKDLEQDETLADFVRNVTSSQSMDTYTKFRYMSLPILQRMCGTIDVEVLTYDRQFTTLRKG